MCKQRKVFLPQGPTLSAILLRNFSPATAMRWAALWLTLAASTGVPMARGSDFLRSACQSLRVSHHHVLLLVAANILLRSSCS